jgi:hypothetical protein
VLRRFGIVLGLILGVVFVALVSLKSQAEFY